MKKVLSLILAALMLASALTGCTTLEKLDNGEYDKGAIIDMYITPEVYNFDPQQTITDESMLKIMSLIFEGLTTINEKGKWQKAGMKNYKIDKDEDGEFSILVNLTSNRWSDGRTVQAADYVYAWKRILEPDNACPASALLFDVKNARKIKMGDATIDDLGVAAVDTYTLEIEFEEKVDLDLFFENCSSIALVPLREDVITRYGKTEWSKKSTTIVTNGPFTPKEIIYGDTLRLERSAYYYLNADKNEALDKYVIPYRLLTKYATGDEAAQLNALNSGDIFYDGEIPLSERSAYASNAVVNDMLVTHTYVFNTTNPLFQKAEVRRALSMALDRTAIANIVTFAKPATGFIPDKTFDTASGTSFRAVGGNLISASADSSAKSLLQSAGVTSGSFAITVRANNAVDLAIAEYVKDAWTALGFSVSINEVKPTLIPNPEGGQNTYEDTFENLYNAGDFDVIAIDATMLSTDAFQPLAQFALSYSGNGVDMNSETYDLYGHVSGYASEEYEALIEQANAEKDRAARATILHQAEAKLLEDMPIVPIVFLQDAYLYSSVLSGIQTTYYGTREFRDTQLKDYMTYKAKTDTSEEAAAAETAAQ